MESLHSTDIVAINPRRKLSNALRKNILDILLKKSENGKLKRGLLDEVAALFLVCKKTVRRIWERAQRCVSNGSMIDVSNKYAGIAGRKRVHIDFNSASTIPLHRRKNIRSLSIALGVPKSTLHRRIKEGHMVSHTSALKPFLTQENKKVRLQFCLSMLERNSLPLEPTFKDMFDYINIDEKWFFMTEKSQRYYLLPNEVEPLRTCKSKQHIPKVMFLAAVARPRFDPSRNEYFSGKIGIFPFTYQEAAKRKSKNRVAGTIETKPILSVTKDITRACLIEKVLPAIREKWPVGERTKTIIIQQDNAKPHISPNDIEFLEAASTDGFDIRLSFQPPNSPDLNVLDLGFFRAIQSLQNEEAPTTIEELVHLVEKAFDNFPIDRLNNVFLTLQQCMIEIMKVHGSNSYKLPHMGKGSLERRDALPIQLTCPIEVVQNVVSYLQ